MLTEPSTPPPLKVLFETPENRLFSFMVDGALDKHYRPWKFRHFEIRSNGTMVYMNEKGMIPKHVLDMAAAKIFKIDILDHAQLGHDSVGVKVECKKNNLLTNFRTVLKHDDLREFCEAIRAVSKGDNNVTKFLNTHDGLISGSNPLHPTQLTMIQNKQAHQIINRDTLSDDSSLSEMRRISRQTYQSHGQNDRHTLTRVSALLNVHERLERRNRILSRRGAFEEFPVFFSSDLVHGSCWFVFGSLFVTASALIVCETRIAYTGLGQDDTNINETVFEAAWIMIVLSGVFFTIGSLAFMRAVAEPPMNPLFKQYYHISTDELLGSWFFLLGVLPGIPYGLLLWFTNHSMLYLGVIIVTLLCLCGTYFFVLACYPTTDAAALGPNKSKLLPYFAYVFGYTPFIKKHFASDWLVGTWIIFWATFLSTFLFGIITAYSYIMDFSVVAKFTNITGTLDCIWFLIGSAYFVAGSFPPPPSVDTSELVENMATLDHVL